MRAEVCRCGVPIERTSVTVWHDRAGRIHECGVQRSYEFAALRAADKAFPGGSSARSPYRATPHDRVLARYDAHVPAEYVPRRAPVRQVGQ